MLKSKGGYSLRFWTAKKVLEGSTNFVNTDGLKGKKPSGLQARFPSYTNTCCNRNTDTVFLQPEQVPTRLIRLLQSATKGKFNIRKKSLGILELLYFPTTSWKFISPFITHSEITKSVHVTLLLFASKRPHEGFRACTIVAVWKRTTRKYIPLD